MPTASDCLFKILNTFGPTCVFASRGYDSMRNGQLSVRPCLLQNELLQFAGTQIKIRQFVLVLSRLTRFWGSKHLCPVNLATFAPQFWVLCKGFKGSWIKIFVHMWSKQLVEKSPQGRLGKTSGGQKISIDLASILFNTHICWIQNSRDLYMSAVPNVQIQHDTTCLLGVKWCECVHFPSCHTLHIALHFAIHILIEQLCN